MKAVVAAFNQEKALVGAFSVITNLRMELFEAPVQTNVTVMTDTGPNPQSLEIRLNIGYFKTAPGIVKLVELVRFRLHSFLHFQVGAYLQISIDKMRRQSNETRTFTLLFLPDSTAQ